jgi:hypothetical protein
LAIVLWVKRSSFIHYSTLKSEFILQSIGSEDEFSSDGLTEFRSYNAALAFMSLCLQRIRYEHILIFGGNLEQRESYVDDHLNNVQSVVIHSLCHLERGVFK